MPATGRAAHKGISWLLVGSLLGLFGLLPATAHADDPPVKQAKPPAPDGDLLEFLGGIGSEDENLIKFLGRTDPRKIAAASAPKPSSSGGAQSSSADPGSQKQ